MEKVREFRRKMSQGRESMLTFVKFLNYFEHRSYISMAPACLPNFVSKSGCQTFLSFSLFNSFICMSCET